MKLYFNKDTQTEIFVKDVANEAEAIAALQYHMYVRRAFLGGKDGEFSFTPKNGKKQKINYTVDGEKRRETIWTNYSLIKD